MKLMYKQQRKDRRIKHHIINSINPAAAESFKLLVQPEKRPSRIKPSRTQPTKQNKRWVENVRDLLL